MSEDHIKVVCRIRPANSRESSSSGQVRQCLTIPDSSNTVVLNAKPENKSFTFDFTADADITQERMFQEVGLPITESCLQGYNGTILCYGQTGSGKTYTIFGNSIDTISDCNRLEKEPLRGLVPRVLEHLWDSFTEAQRADDKYTFECKCSFYEIYQERVFDLLDVSGSQNVAGLQVREDSKQGVYVEGCTEEAVTSTKDAHAILVKGYQNRHVAETNMNRESSRSHAVFQLSIETSTERPGDGIVVRRKARFSMVDLAGSERQKDTNASGERLKEASVINKSLSTLGHVINALADVASNGGRKHIHYRDSKLTFLLRDSLGGNSKTTLVATVSPAELCLAETLSTLKFAQRAKAIRNSAVLNEEASGSIEALQREITQLKAQLAETSHRKENIGLEDNKCATGPNAGEVSALILDAVKRCELADEQKKRAEAKGTSLVQQLEQSKSSIMGVKYMLKMRESEISRLKKKSATPAEGETSTEELLKVATNAVKDEMQGEIMKLRLEVKEQKEVIQDLRQDVGGAKWTPENEITFNHTLHALMESHRESTELLKKQNLALAEGKFAEEFGFTPTEATELRDKLAVTESRLEEALTRLPQLQHGVVLLQKMLDEANGAADELRVDLESEKVKAEGFQAMETLTEELRREIAEKDDFIKQLEGGMKKSDSELKEQLRLREGEFKDKMNLVMKDNTVLLKRCRELESAVAEFQGTLDVAVKSREAQKILVENSRLQIASMEAEHTERLRVLQEGVNTSARELEGSRKACEDAESRERSLRAENNGIVKRVAEAEAALQQSQQELSQARFEAENAVEDADNLFSQTQALIDERQCLLSNVADAQSEISALKRGLAEQSKTEEEMTALKSKYEDLKVVYDKLKAESSSAAAALESEFSMTLSTVKSLERKVVCLEENLECERKNMTEAQAKAVEHLQEERDAAIAATVAEAERGYVAEKEALKAELGAGFESKISLLTKELENERDQRDQLMVQLAKMREVEAEHLIAVQSLESELALEKEKLQHSVEKLADSQSRLQDEEQQKVNAEALDIKIAESAALSIELRDTKKKLSDMNAERELSLSRRIAEALQLKEAQAGQSEAEAAKRAALNQLVVLQQEHAALCGHQNNKQKIHQHMALKQDLQDQTKLLKQQQEQLVQITFERDAARAEASRLRKEMKSVAVTAAPRASVVFTGSKASVPPAKDSENIENAHRSSPESMTI